MPSPKSSAPKKRASSSVMIGRRQDLAADKPRKLTVMTAKQKALINYIGQGESVVSAAARAGYTDNGTSAYRMMKDPAVLELIAQRKAAYEKASDMTRQKVMNGLLEAAEMAKLMAEPSSMVAAWREIGKMCGYYAPVETRVRVEGNIVLDKMEKLTEAELLELVQGAQAQISQSINHQEDADDDIPAPAESSYGAPALEFDEAPGSDD